MGQEHQVKMKHDQSSSSPGSMEASILTLPTLKDGVITLGDLWDCRSATAVGTLFDKPLRLEHLDVHPISTLEYSLERVQDAKDFLANMFISVTLGLECAGGLVKVKGKASFDRQEREKYHEEMILCNYDAATFEVRLRPGATAFTGEEDKDVVSRKVLDLINEGALSATHFVQSVTLGGQAQASINYYENISKSHMDLMGSLEGTISMGPITASAKASLQLLDSQYSEDYSTFITVKGQPGFPSCPTTCEQMFKDIENMDTVLSLEAHFPQLNRCGEDSRIVIGVPLRFRLMPLTHLGDLLDLGDPTYMLLKEETLNNFSAMLLSLSDYVYKDYLKKLMREETPQIVPILHDPHHPISMKVAALSTLLTEKAEPIRLESLKVFSDYKYGLATEEELESFLTKFREEIPMGEIKEELSLLALQGRKELIAIRAADVVHIVDGEGNPAIEFFTNRPSMEEWYGLNRTGKLLLKTTIIQQKEGQEESPIFQNIFASSQALKDAGMEVGIAFPSICTEGQFSLSYKTHGGEKVYKGADEMPFVIDLLKMMNDIRPKEVFQEFYSILAEIYFIKVPMTLEDLTDFPTLVDVMKGFKEDAIVVETYCELLAILREKRDEWNFVLPLGDSLQRGVEMVKVFERLRRVVRGKGIEGSWLVSKFDVYSQTSAPLLSVFRGSDLMAICYDGLDLAVLIQCLASQGNGEGWEVLRPEKAMTSCLYIDEWNFAAEMIPNFVLDHSSHLQEPIPRPHEPFGDNENRGRLNEAMEVIKWLALRNDEMVATAVARIALQTYSNELEPVLVKRCHWKENRIPREKWKDVEWESLGEDVTAIIQAGTPHLVKVTATRKILKELQEPARPEEPEEPPPEEMVMEEEPPEEDDTEMHLKIDGMIAFIVEDEGSEESIKLAPLREKVVGIDRENFPAWFDRKERLLIELDTFLTNEIERGPVANLLQILNISTQMQNQGSLSSFPAQIAEWYCSRAQLPEEQYPKAKQDIAEALNQGRMFHCLQILNKAKVHPKLFRLQGEFAKFTELPSSPRTKAVLKLLQTFSIEQLEIVWGNPRFLFMIRQGLEDVGVIESLLTLLLPFLNEDHTIPYFIPQDVANAVKPYLARDIRTALRFPWEIEWGGELDVFIEQLRTCTTRGVVPEEFQNALLQNVLLSSKLEELLKAKDALFFWDDEKRLFAYTWTFTTVARALDRLSSPALRTTSQGIGPSRGFQIATASDEATHSKGIAVVEEWLPFTTNGILNPISLQNLFIYQPATLSPMKLGRDQINKACDVLVPYVAKHLNNPEVLSASSIVGMIEYPQPGGPHPGEIDFGLEPAPKTQPHMVFKREALYTSLLQNEKDPVLVHNILQRSALTSHVVPVFLNNILVTRERNWISLLDALQGVSLPPAKSFAPSFFLTPPYRFILTLRTGDSMLPLSGRSSLTSKYILKPPATFGCYSEAGSHLGIPLGRNRTLEMVPLSEETCREGFYELIKGKHHGEPLFLGVLHGDLLSVEDEMFHTLAPFVSGVVTFYHTTKGLKELKSLKRKVSVKLDSSFRKEVKCFDIVLYPNKKVEEQVGRENCLQPVLGLGIPEIEMENAANLGNIVATALLASEIREDDLSLGPRDAVPEQVGKLGTNESRKFLGLVASRTLPIVKRMITDFASKGEGDEATFLETEIAVGFLEILYMEKGPARSSALHHVMVELDRRSETFKVSKLRKKIASSRAELSFLLQNPLSLQSHQRQELKVDIKHQLGKLESLVLSLAKLLHFVGLYIKRHRGGNLGQFCKFFGEFFQEGFLIDMEDCFSQEFAEILQDSVAFIPSTRVIPLAVTGVANCGKSTLCNHLYGGRFHPEGSPGYGGLGIRLVWLDPDIREEMDGDAILLLDSEGMAAPENEGDEEATAQSVKVFTNLLSNSALMAVSFGGNDVGVQALLNIVGAGLLTTVLEGLNPAPNMELILCEREVTPGYSNDEREMFKEMISEKFMEMLDNVGNLCEQGGRVDLGLKAEEPSHLAKLHTKSVLKEWVPLLAVGNLGQKEFHENVGKVRKAMEKGCIQSRTFDERLTLAEWMERSMETKNLLAFRNSHEASLGLGSKRVKREAKVVIGQAFLCHELKLWGKFEKGLDDIFRNVDGKKQMELFGNIQSHDVNFLLNQIATDLLRVPNTCLVAAEEEEEGDALLQQPSKGCEDCQAAYEMKELAFATFHQHKGPNSFLEIEEMERNTNLHRVLVYSFFKQRALLTQIKYRKSQRLKDKVAQIVADVPGGNMNPTEVYIRFLQFLSTEQIMPNWRDQFVDEYSGFFSVFVDIRNDDIEGLGVPVNLEEIPAFLPNWFHTESSFVLPPVRNKLEWGDAIWLRRKLEELPGKVFKEFGDLWYHWEMGVVVGQRVMEILELLIERLRRNGVTELGQISPELIKAVVKCGADFCKMWLSEREGVFRRGWDAVRVMEGRKIEFVRDPMGYFEGEDPDAGFMRIGIFN